MLLPGRALPWLHAAAGAHSCAKCWCVQVKACHDCQEEYACTCLLSRLPSWLDVVCRRLSLCRQAMCYQGLGHTFRVLPATAACGLQGSGCNYFAWADELEKAAASGGGPSSSQTGSPAASQQGSPGRLCVDDEDQNCCVHVPCAAKLMEPQMLRWQNCSRCLVQCSRLSMPYLVTWLCRAHCAVCMFGQVLVCCVLHVPAGLTVLCDCGIQCRRLQSHSAANPDRWFYK